MNRNREAIVLSVELISMEVVERENVCGRWRKLVGETGCCQKETFVNDYCLLYILTRTQKASLLRLFVC